MTNFDKAILDYLLNNQPEILDSFITSPLTILESTIIPDNHKLLDEAIIIIDSLNSYNKGLLNDENEVELLEIKTDSPLYSWRCGTLAIKEYYQNNQSLVTEYLNEVRKESPVKHLNKYILRDSQLYMFTKNQDLESSSTALKEVIENSLLDMYPSTVNLLLQDCPKDDPTKFENIILTIIEESVDNIPLEIIHKSFINFIPVCESTRLMALGTIYKLPINSLEYLFSFVTQKNYTDPDDLNLKAVLSVISDIVKSIINEGYSFDNREIKAEFTKNCQLFINIIQKIFDNHFIPSNNPLTNLKRAIEIEDKKVSTTITQTTLQRELF